MTNKPASKETIDLLIENVAKAIQDLYVSIKKDIAVKETLGESLPRLYMTAINLRIGVQLVVMDFGVSFRALFLCDNAFEKRFHMKNLMASMLEGYKLILGFDDTKTKAIKHSLLGQLRNELTTSDTIELITECDQLIARFDDVIADCIDKEVRDLTFHYDSNMIKVFHKTIAVNNEELVAHKVSAYWGMLQDILIFCNEIEKQLEESLPVAQVKVNLVTNPLHGVFKRQISKDGALVDVLSSVINKGSAQLDKMAANAERIQKFRTFVETQTSISFPVPELDNMSVLTNSELLIRFMAIDLSSVMNAYLRSESDIEAALNLRRVVIIKTSALDHLCGKKSDDEASIWKSIKSMIPAGNPELQEVGGEIEAFLNTLASNTSDWKLRHLFAHYDSSKQRKNIESIISQLEALDPLKQTAEIKLLIQTYSVLTKFSTQLMTVLTLNAKKQRLESQKKMEDALGRIQLMVSSANADDSITTSILESTKKIRNLIER